jgi:hypothetical protein
MRTLGLILLISSLTAGFACAEESTGKTTDSDQRGVAALTDYNQKYIDEVNSERQLENAKADERAKFHEKLADKIKH